MRRTKGSKGGGRVEGERGGVGQKRRRRRQGGGKQRMGEGRGEGERFAWQACFTPLQEVGVTLCIMHDFNHCRLLLQQELRTASYVYVLELDVRFWGDFVSSCAT